MTWFTFALLTAVSVAAHDAWVKKWFSRHSAWEMAAFPLFYSLPPCLAGLAFIHVPPLDEVFFLTFAFCLPLNAIPFFMYIKAIQVSPLSLTVPYLAFTPVFMVFTGWLFLDETPDAWGIAGIVGVCAGSYVLNLTPGLASIWSPFRAVFQETGSWMMMVVAMMYSVTSVLGKLAILHSSPLFFQVSFFVVFNTLMLAVFRGAGKIRLAALCLRPAAGAMAGALFFLHILFHGIGISLVKAAYMVSVKRLSVVLGVILGGLFFHEPHFRIRLAGALLMFIGAAGIVLMAR